MVSPCVASLLHHLWESIAVPAVETEWVDGVIPPCRHWRVVHRYLGLFTAGIYLDADSCFAANATCRRIYSRYPTNKHGDYQPLTVPQPADPADLSDGGAGDLDAGSDLDPDDVPAAGDGGDPDQGGGLAAEAVPGGDRGSGGVRDLFLADSPHDPGADTGIPGLRDPSACELLSKGRMK